MFFKHKLVFIDEICITTKYIDYVVILFGLCDYRYSISGTLKPSECPVRGSSFLTVQNITYTV